MAGSDDSLDKSDLDDTAESQDHYKTYQRSPIILELGQKVGSERSAFVRHGMMQKIENPSSPLENNLRNLPEMEQNPNVSRSEDNQSPPRKKKNPYSIEELLKKDESKDIYKRPRLLNTGVVQPCGIVVGKDV